VSSFSGCGEAWDAGGKDRLDKMEQNAKSLAELQRLNNNTLQNNDYNLPSMVASEVEIADKKMEQLFDGLMGNKYGGTDVSKLNGNLSKVKEILTSVKSLSKELAEKLEGDIVQSTEEKKEGDVTMGTPKIESTSTVGTLVNGSKNDTSEGAPNDSAKGSTKGDSKGTKGSKGKKASKTLKLQQIRQSYENLMKIENAAVPPPSPPEPNTIQFLATTATTTTQQPEDNVKPDFDKKVTFNGNILDRIAAVPSSEGVVGSENTLASMKSASNAGSDTIHQPDAAASYYPASSEAMNHALPTMAPPMFQHRTFSEGSLAGGGSQLDLELESKLKKKKKKKKDKKDKKRARESISHAEGSVAGSSDSAGPKKKRSKSRKSEGKGSEAEQLAATNTTSEVNGNADKSIGVKPPPPQKSPAKQFPPSKNPSGAIRMLPSLTPTPKHYTISTDPNPQRIYNPLLRLPQFPNQQPNGSDPPLEEIPQAGELWNFANIHFWEEDTYPISYLARVLGFDVEETGVGMKFGGEFDAMTVPMRKNAANDDVSLVPESGSFCDRVWQSQGKSFGTGEGGAASYDNNGMHDDRNLTYSDPLYTNILSSYHGYNEEDFKDYAGKGFLDDLSSQCLEFAKERSVLGVKDEKDSGQKDGCGMKFRFGNEKDKALLMSLEEKCQWKSHPKHDLATNLRSQHHFCIVAESSSTGENTQSPIAFLQYRFCWYAVEEKKGWGNVSTDKISELVVFIDNLIYNDVDTVASDVGGADGGEETKTTTPVSQNDLETAKVLLTSLALVHAARAGIWYGMMESPLSLVPFFTRYFRMGNVSTEESSDDAPNTIPLVLDIKKCHFKYSILLLEESLKAQSKCQERNNHDVSSERMIVHLSNNTANSGEMTRFSNSSIDEARLKKAHIRLLRQSNNAQVFSVSAASRGDETKEVQNPIDPSSIVVSANWNVVRLFPLGNTAQKDLGKKEESDSNDTSDDIFLAELKKKQTKLLELESSIETTSRGILSKAYDEHSEFVNGNSQAKRELDKKKLEEYQAVQTRLHEAELAWQAQLDQDMDAVCDVCWDGEVTPDNQIIFCDACNVAVHQRCYGIDQIPSGNYFCHTCTHFEIDKEYLAAKRRDGPPMKITRHPIVCELCPRRQGAFVHVQTLVPAKKAKWVHVGCAKWQGMNYVDVELKDEIEDLTTLKQHFKYQDIKCTLCKSGIGAFHQCREEGCEKWLHLTCARSLGKCSVQHGENCEGFYDPETLDHPPWSLSCAEHSEVDPESVKEGSLSPEQLVAIAESYPPEPLPLKLFNKMNATERKEYWSDRENLAEFFEKVMTSLEGAKCALCEMPADPTIDKRCDTCGDFSHADCADPLRGESATCLTCRFTEENANTRHYEEPYCHMCSHPNQSGGPLVRTVAKPVSMKIWKGASLKFQKSIFGKNKFCHALCGMWNPNCDPENNEEQGTIINCSNITMANGKDHVSHQFRCTLCGLNKGAKVDCAVDRCVAPGGRKTSCKFHITCARQAGLAVLPDDFTVKCFNHGECTYVFRARLEDLREIELTRFSSKTLKTSNPMSWDHASSLFHASVNIMRTLGWAWRWAEWWVESGDNWEPLIEEGQVEAEMTDEELKVVPSDRESRCKDARRCRLAAFGAALRNRDYDKMDGDDQEPLDRALTAILSTKSLVGPLKKKEIEFFVTWLALAYRSKSPVLGFGDYKTEVASDSFCVHQDDGSPKYELGSRPLPGKAGPQKGVFEPPVDEADDFLKTPVATSPAKKSKKRKTSNIAPDSGDTLNDQDDFLKSPVPRIPRKKKKRKKSSVAPDSGATLNDQNDI